MIPVHQTRISQIDGNCTEAVFASLLEVDIKIIPDFHNHEISYWYGVGEFLKEFDLQLLRIDVGKENGIYPFHGIYFCGEANFRSFKSKGFCWLSVKSKTFDGSGHAIVGLNGEPYFDVNPNFIAQEEEYEIEAYNVLISTNPANNKKRKKEV